MVTTVKKWGNSMGIRLPKSVVQEVGLTEGATVTIEAKEGQIVITPLRRPRYALKDLVGRITTRNRHAAVETGKPVGKEIW
jgi:antitoxin MazE